MLLPVVGVAACVSEWMKRNETKGRFSHNLLQMIFHASSRERSFITRIAKTLGLHYSKSRALNIHVGLWKLKVLLFPRSMLQEQQSTKLCANPIERETTAFLWVRNEIWYFQLRHAARLCSAGWIDSLPRSLWFDFGNWMKNAFCWQRATCRSPRNCWRSSFLLWNYACSQLNCISLAQFTKRAENLLRKHLN